MRGKMEGPHSALDLHDSKRNKGKDTLCSSNNQESICQIVSTFSCVHFCQVMWWLLDNHNNQVSERAFARRTWWTLGLLPPFTFALLHTIDKNILGLLACLATLNLRTFLALQRWDWLWLELQTFCLLSPYISVNRNYLIIFFLFNIGPKKVTHEWKKEE